MKKNIFCFVAFLILNTGILLSQNITQTIKGTVVDEASQSSIPGATIAIVSVEPVLGTTSDKNGFFRIENVPIGRHNVKISFIGYEPYIIKEMIVGSGKEIVLNVGLIESVTKLNEIIIKAESSNKSEPINSMTTLSAKQISMEEANRYAGGFDDPARLVSAFAGVSYCGFESNGIVIRGNAPKGLLWKMEGIQIPNPNHFAEYVSLGGGAVTALSSQTMSNSDFLTGAFPAEYGNALSGVFDIKMRTGNTEKREHAFQAGLIGIDFASEGPFAKGKPASYLFNYRYSALGLLAPILPKEMGILRYQDLSFKLNFPTKKIGTFTLWGIGALDYQGKEPVNDSSLWKTENDKENYFISLSMGAIGLNHKIILGNNTYLNTTLSPTESSLDWSEKKYDNNLVLVPESKTNDYRWKYTLSSFINHKFSAKHTNKTGIILNRIVYNINIERAEIFGTPMLKYVSKKNGSELLQFYSQSKVNIKNNFIINLGFHSQYFLLNNKYSIEPRCAVKWSFGKRYSLSFAYGLHTQLEMIPLYHIQIINTNDIITPNKNLDFAKAHHFVIGYNFQINDNILLKIEPYYQILFDVPVVPNSYISTINLDEIWSFNDSLVNKGTGKNIGVDITLEKYLSKGLYYIITASLFDSKYTGGDDIERNTRYNRKYMINFLLGKEWFVDKNNNNILGINLRFSYMGGNYINPLNVAETITHEEIIEDYTKSYTLKLPDSRMLSAALNYKINKRRHTSSWTVQIMNALGDKDFKGYTFDKTKKSIEKKYDILIVPNISYKIEF